MYAQRHETVKPGSYVLLAFSDTGIGMDSGTMSRVFEPFFTTKGLRGTGLGLSTVYGIVKQSNGYIWVYSEQSVGTTFKIYLPRVDKPAQSLIRKSSENLYPTGTETILVAEDETSFRELVVSLLQGSGYRVLEAGNVSVALKYAGDTATTIDLLLADVVMPDMLGPELASRIREYRPALRTLYMSGYTRDFGVRDTLDPEVPLLSKPFSRSSLLTKVREVLDGGHN
jgi:CheY-like chemotaxis protein